MSETHKYYWLKLRRDFFKRHDVKIIESQENGKDYLLFYLKLLVEAIDHEGSLRFSDTIPYDEKMLATITDTNIDIVRAACQAFQALGMMEKLDDGTIFMAHVEKMIGSETNDAIRMREARARKQIIATQEKGEHCSETFANRSPELETEIDIEIEKEHTRGAPAPVPPNFLKTVYDAWMACPALPRLQDFLGFSISDQARRAMAAWQGNHSDDILAAVRNYGEIAAHPRDYWPKGRPGMAGFFEGEIFLKCLPANFPDSCYTDDAREAAKKARRPKVERIPLPPPCKCGEVLKSNLFTQEGMCLSCGAMYSWNVYKKAWQEDPREEEEHTESVVHEGETLSAKLAGVIKRKEARG